LDSLKINFLNIDSNICIYNLALRHKRIKDIIITKEVISVSTFKKLYLFSFENGKTKLEDTLVHKYDNIQYFGDSLLFFYNNYNFHPLDCPPEQRSRFGVYNLFTRTFKKEINNHFNYYYYTHLISKYIDVSPNHKMIAFANTLPYNIRIFNSNLNITDSIEGNIKYDKYTLDNLNKFQDTIFNEKGSVKNVIYKVSKNDKYVDRVFKVYFLDDSTLLVLKKMSKSNNNVKERNLDVWRKSDSKNNWKLIVDNQSYFSSRVFIKEDSTIDINVSFRHSNPVFINSPYMYVVGSYYPFDKLIKYKDLMNYQKGIRRDEVDYGVYRFKYEIK